MKKRGSLIGTAAVLVVLAAISSVFAAGAPIADWELVEQDSARAPKIEVVSGGITSMFQRKDLEQRFLSFGVQAVDGQGFIPDIRYQDFHLTWEYGGTLRGVQMVVRRADDSAATFYADGEDGAFLQNKAIEPVSGGYLQVEFHGIVEEVGQLQYSLEFQTVDLYGHTIDTPTISGTVEVREQRWMVGNNGEMEIALKQALPGDTIEVAEGWFQLPQTPVDPMESITITGQGASTTRLVGQLRLEDGSILQSLALFNDWSHEREGYQLIYQDTTALRTRGSVILRGLLVSGSNSWVAMGSSDLGLTVPADILVEDSIFIGRGGLTVDVFHSMDLANPVIHGNIFISQEHCGIDISIDVVFSDVEGDDARFTAFEEYAAAIESANTFVNIGQPVCGARG